MPSPMPDAAPVMKATLPRNSFMREAPRLARLSDAILPERACPHTIFFGRVMYAVHASVPGDRSGADRDRSLRHPLVCARLYRGAFARLVVREALCRQATAGDERAGRGRFLGVGD